MKYTHDSKVWLFRAVKLIFGEYETHWSGQTPVNLTVQEFKDKFEDILSLYVQAFPDLTPPKSAEAVELQVRFAVANYSTGYLNNNQRETALKLREAAIEAGFMKLHTALRFNTSLRGY